MPVITQKLRILPHLGIVVFSLAIVALTPINTDIGYYHIAIMGIMLLSVIAGPYVFCRFVTRDNAIAFHFLNGRHWHKHEYVYIGVMAAIAYLMLPLYFALTGTYHNWTVIPGANYLIRLFLGTQFLGLWDELFFVNTVLALLRKHLSFTLANALQAVFWTAFLYQLGFRSWAPLALYPFALLQGYIYKRTGSLLYIIAIHLTLDCVLFFAILHAYHPDWVPVFVT